MSTEPRVVVSFAECRTREEAVAKFSAWLDEHCTGLVRTHAARLLAENRRCRHITAEIAALRSELAEQQIDRLARFVEILDEACRA